MHPVRSLALLLALTCAALFAAPGAAFACDGADLDAPATIATPLTIDAAPEPIHWPDEPDRLFCEIDGDEDDDSDDDLLPQRRGLSEVALPVARRGPSSLENRAPPLRSSSIFRPPRSV